MYRYANNFDSSTLNRDWNAEPWLFVQNCIHKKTQRFYIVSMYSYWYIKWSHSRWYIGPKTLTRFICVVVCFFVVHWIAYHTANHQSQQHKHQTIDLFVIPQHRLWCIAEAEISRELSDSRKLSEEKLFSIDFIFTFKTDIYITPTHERFY